jgi:phospholipid/cholesterol/gamma-HCH transport system substrate-binding protein
MPRESNLELKVGIFVVAGLVTLGAIVFSISDFSLFDKGRTITAVFGFANGLKKNAPVRLAGVESGLVKDLKIFYDRSDERTKVKVTMWLGQDVQIPADSTVIINQLGLMGEKYVEIIPGSEKENFLADDAAITGRDPVAMEELSSMFDGIARELEKSIAGFNEVVLNEKNRQSLAGTLEALSVITGDIRSGKGTIGQLLYDDGLYHNLEEMTADLKENPWKLLYRPKR